jgi:hypothetical protein
MTRFGYAWPVKMAGWIALMRDQWFAVDAGGEETAAQTAQTILSVADDGCERLLAGP